MSLRPQANVLCVLAAAAEKKYSLSSSEDEFDWAKSSKRTRAVIEEESFNPEPSGASDSDMDSPPPAPVV